MKRLLWRGVAGILLAACVMTVRADVALSLNGVSDFVELRRSFYLAALLLERPSADADAILASDQAKQLVLKVTADRWTPMRFSSQWSRALIINNEAAELERLGDAVIEFNNLLQEDLVYGDELVITRDRDGSSRVELNGQLAFSVARPGFAELLLNTWIGPRPPSTEFRQQLLGQQRDAALVGRYWGMAPAAEREQIVSQWRTPQQATEPAAAPAAVAAALPPTTVVRAARVGSGATAARADMEDAEDADATAAQAQEEAAGALESTDAAQQAAALDPADLARLQPVEVTARMTQPSPIEEPLAERPGSVTVAAAAPEVFDDAEPATLEQRLSQEEEEALIQLYQNLVVRKILGNVEYPALALRRNLQGVVQLRVRVDRSGQILTIEDMELSRHAILNDAARDAVVRTENFPRLPAALYGDHVEVQVPIRFRLQ